MLRSDSTIDVPDLPRNPWISPYTAPARTRLIRGLAEVIQRDGYRDSKIRDVATEAHVSLRTFYKEFETKDEVLVALHGVVNARMLQAVREMTRFDGPFPAVAHRAFTELITLLMSNPNLTRAMLVDLATLSADARRERERGMQELTALLGALIDEAREVYPGVITRPLTPMAARAIIGAVIELVTSREALNPDPDCSRFADAVTELLLSVVTDAA